MTRNSKYTQEFKDSTIQLVMKGEKSVLKIGGRFRSKSKDYIQLGIMSPQKNTKLNNFYIPKRYNKIKKQERYHE